MSTLSDLDSSREMIMEKIGEKKTVRPGSSFISLKFSFNLLLCIKWKLNTAKGSRKKVIFYVARPQRGVWRALNSTKNPPINVATKLDGLTVEVIDK